MAIKTIIIDFRELDGMKMKNCSTFFGQFIPEGSKFVSAEFFHSFEYEFEISQIHIEYE